MPQMLLINVPTEPAHLPVFPFLEKYHLHLIVYIIHPGVMLNNPLLVTKSFRSYSFNPSELCFLTNALIQEFMTSLLDYYHNLTSFS